MNGLVNSITDYVVEALAKRYASDPVVRTYVIRRAGELILNDLETNTGGELTDADKEILDDLLSSP